MKYYTTNTGSNFFGINIENSDNDTIIVTDDNIHSGITKNEHLIIQTPENAIIQLNGFVTVPQWLGLMFPRPEDTGELAEYMRQNNDHILLANEKYVYDMLIKFMEMYQILDLDNYYQFSKKIAYRYYFSELFLDFIKTKDFELSISKIDKEYCKEIRRKNIPFPEVKEQIKDNLEKLKTYKTTEDLSFLYQNTDNLIQILNTSQEKLNIYINERQHKIPQCEILLR